MKGNWKRFLALFLAVAMILVSGVVLTNEGFKASNDPTSSSGHKHTEECYHHHSDNNYDCQVHLTNPDGTLKCHVIDGEECRTQVGTVDKTCDIYEHVHTVENGCYDPETWEMTCEIFEHVHSDWCLTDVGNVNVGCSREHCTKGTCNPNEPYDMNYFGAHPEWPCHLGYVDGQLICGLEETEDEEEAEEEAVYNLTINYYKDDFEEKTSTLVNTEYVRVNSEGNFVDGPYTTTLIDRFYMYDKSCTNWDASSNTSFSGEILFTPKPSSDIYMNLSPEVGKFLPAQITLDKVSPTVGKLTRDLVLDLQFIAIPEELMKGEEVHNLTVNHNFYLEDETFVSSSTETCPISVKGDIPANIPSKGYGSDVIEIDGRQYEILFVDAWTMDGTTKIRTRDNEESLGVTIEGLYSTSKPAWEEYDDNDAFITSDQVVEIQYILREVVSEASYTIKFADAGTMEIIDAIEPVTENGLEPGYVLTYDEINGYLKDYTVDGVTYKYVGMVGDYFEDGETMLLPGNNEFIVLLNSNKGVHTFTVNQFVQLPDGSYPETPDITKNGYIDNGAIFLGDSTTGVASITSEDVIRYGSEIVVSKKVENGQEEDVEKDGIVSYTFYADDYTEDVVIDLYYKVPYTKYTINVVDDKGTPLFTKTLDGIIGASVNAMDDADVASYVNKLTADGKYEAVPDKTNDSLDKLDKKAEKNVMTLVYKRIYTVTINYINSLTGEKVAPTDVRRIATNGAIYSPDGTLPKIEGNALVGAVVTPDLKEQKLIPWDASTRKATANSNGQSLSIKSSYENAWGIPLDNEYGYDEETGYIIIPKDVKINQVALLNVGENVDDDYIIDIFYWPYAEKGDKIDTPEDNKGGNTGETPENPGTTPENPGTTPENPGTTPETPGTTPETPVVTPETPVVTPETPVVTPRPPVVTPETPAVTPETPVVTPETPVVTPETPVVTPETPVVTPETPVVTPEAPVATPEAPAAPEANVTTPLIPAPPVAVPLDNLVPVQIRTDGDGTISLTEVADVEAALADLDLGHICNILYFIMLLCTTVALGFYYRSAKLHNERIFELRKELGEDDPYKKN